jgi:RNA polymerase sigma factor (sigma-70 family)
MGMEPKERTDWQLLNLAGNDPGAFALLYLRYCETVYRYARSILREGDLAAGVTAETFVRLFQHCTRLAAMRIPLQPWLFAVAGNLHRNELRRGSRVVILDERRVALAESDTDCQEALGTHGADIRYAVEALAPFQCTCINLRYGEGMTTTDIASRLQCSRRQVTVALDDAYKTLRGRLAALLS